VPLIFFAVSVSHSNIDRQQAHHVKAAFEKCNQKSDHCAVSVSFYGFLSCSSVCVIILCRPQDQ